VIFAIRNVYMFMRKISTFAIALALTAVATNASGASLTDTLSIDEVVVTGTRSQSDVRHTPFTVSQITRSEIVNRQSPSLLEVIGEQVPGYFSTARGILGYGVSTGAAGAMSIRGIGGSPSTGVLVLIDGHPQYMGIMGHSISDAYQSMLAEKVEVLSGPASMLYGSNAMGGVVNIITRKMLSDGVKGDIRVAGGSYGTLTTEGTARMRFGKFSGIGALSYNRTDGHRANTHFDQFSGYAKVGYDFSAQWKAFADLNMTHFNASNPGSVYSPMIDNDQHITRGMASLSVEDHYEHNSGGVSIFVNWGRHKINDGYQAGGSPKEYYFRSNDHVAGFNDWQALRLFEGNTITVGFDYQHIGGKAWNDYAAMTGVDASNNVQLVDTAMNEVAGYVDVKQDIASVLTLEAGVRYDHHSVAGGEWIPQAAAVVRLTPQMELKLSAGKGFRNPTLMNLFMFRPANADLKAERIWNYEIDFTGRALDGALRYGANVYFLKGDNLIQTVAGHNQNTGKVQNFGIELQAAYRIDAHWQVNANYSWINKKYDIVAVPVHKLYGEGNFTSGRWTATLGLMWVNHLTTRVETESLARELSSYVLLNARVGFAINRYVQLFAKGDNLLAQKYEINYGYPMPRATFMGGVRLSF